MYETIPFKFSASNLQMRFEFEYDREFEFEFEFKMRARVHVQRILKRIGINSCAENQLRTLMRMWTSTRMNTRALALHAQ